MIHGVFYMAHPLTPDDRFTFEQNMNHTVKLLGILLRLDLRVIAPYHTQCLVLDNSNEKDRSLGLTIDFAVIKVLDGLVLVGHKLSDGMRRELHVAEQHGKIVINLLGIPDRLLPNILRTIR